MPMSGRGHVTVMRSTPACVGSVIKPFKHISWPSWRTDSLEGQSANTITKKKIMSNLLKRKHQEETEFRANAEELKLSHNDLKPSSAELHFQQLLLSHIVARMANAMVSKESRLPSWWNLMLHKSWNLWCQCFRAGLTLKLLNADCTQCNTEFATQKDPEEGVPRAISCSGASSPECEPKYTPHLITERVAKG